MVARLQILSVLQMLCLAIDVNYPLVPFLGCGEVMPHFVYEQAEAREVKELTLDGIVESTAVALIKVCLTVEPELLAPPLQLRYPIHTFMNPLPRRQGWW